MNNPPPLERSRRHGEEIGFYERSSPERWQPNNYILKADSRSRKVHSAMWLIAIFAVFIGLVWVVVSLFV